MEQGMIEIQEKVIESDNERLKQPISIDQFIQEFILTKKPPPIYLRSIQCTCKIKKNHETPQGVQLY